MLTLKKSTLNHCFQYCNWYVHCFNKSFVICNNGMKLAVRGDENLEKVIFDNEKKIISVVVKNPTLSEKIPKTLDLSDATEFFEELRKNIETILTTKWATFTLVIPNDDRTVFKVS